MKIFKAICHIFCVIGLTALSQLGGIAYAVSLITPKHSKRWRVSKFVGAYCVLWIMAMLTAPIFGRVPLACAPGSSSNLKMQSPIYCVLNRHYVTPELKTVAFNLADHVNMKYPDTKTLALDANFPFIDGVLLFPHLSHDDGRKLDLAYYYSKNGKTRSPIGYWAFEGPLNHEYQPCQSLPRPNLRWEMKWLTPLHKDMKFDPARTKTALSWLADEGKRQGVTKVFIEPHLARRIGVSGEVIRFQGCHAARHDDHIHFQIR